jgi:hypothetical protein
MVSLHLAQFCSQLQLPHNITITADNARSPTCAGTTQSNNMNQTATLRRKMTSCRWRSSPSSQSMPSMPTRTHGQRWDSCQRRTKTTDAAPLLPQRRSENPIELSLHALNFFGVKPVLMGKHRNRASPQLSQKGQVTENYKAQQRQRNEPEHYSLPAIPAVVVTAVFADRKPASSGYQRYPDLDYAVRSTPSWSWHAMDGCLGP